jgi:hypothetical protein
MSDIVYGEQTIKLKSGEELHLTAGIKDCTIIVTVIEGEIAADHGSELLRLRHELDILRAGVDARKGGIWVR